MEKHERIAALAERMRELGYRLEADGADGGEIWRGQAELAIDDLEVLSSQPDRCDHDYSSGMTGWPPQCTKCGHIADESWFRP